MSEVAPSQFGTGHPVYVQMLDYRTSERLSMADAPRIGATIQKTLELASRCTQLETSDNYGALGDQVEELEGQARQAFLAKVEIASLLPKLKTGKPLTPEDLKTLELLIVGDAEYFLKYENDLEQWKSEIKKLLGEISNLQSSDLDVDGLMHLRALCAEVGRVLPDVVYYLNQKERTSKFQAATREPLDSEGYRVLAEIVEQMLLSGKT
jgi:hypothetical protein